MNRSTALSRIDYMKSIFRLSRSIVTDYEYQKILIAKSAIERIIAKTSISTFQEVELKVFSQWGDDGIIQWLIHNSDFPNKTFVEFGVEDYRESNTRFLLMNDNWSGLVMDGSSANIDKLMKADYFWKHDLNAKAVFVDKDNINAIISSYNYHPEVGILHIDLDGNDYWIWKEINVINPVIVILEYNSVFGCEREITVPYDKNFYRTKAHFSNLYYGASLPALYELSKSRGYSFVGCNSAGNNAYFVRNDKVHGNIKEISLKDGFVDSKLRESRSKNGTLSYLSGTKRLEAIKGLEVINVKTNKVEVL